MTREPLLELTDARVVRDGREILCVEHLLVAEGEHLAVLGPNGAGKTTLVSLLTGAVLPVWAPVAPVRFRGARLWDIAEARRHIGVVSHRMQDALDRSLRATDAVLGGLFGAIGVPVHAVASADDERRAFEALELLGVAHLANRTMSTLSTGEARRVVIARALVAEPSILVLDEPTAGLDPGAAVHVRAAIRSLLEHGASLLLVTHHVEDIPAEVERALLLEGGRIVADGPAEELLTGERLSELFGAPLEVERRESGWRLR